ncbi:DUF3515 family protein [Micromonospora echinofusca]|uniref:DUF3515 family protein n=2 Tax=Micromonospora echinofusca TaxID=47858 RepID=A0ABS3VW24_MICEH|nr:DUF3515 family protein [Micromonospora echinofusca]
MTDDPSAVDLDRPATTGAGTPTGGGRSGDRAARQAALWATLVAVPVTVAVALFAFARLSPDAPETPDAPVAGPSATAARPQSTTPVELAAPQLGERQATVCRALLSQLPPTVRDLAQRPVTAGAEQNAAYGDPALTLACGVAPVEVPPTDDVWVINGVCWHAAQRPEATVLTTVDREVPVQVTVPRAYEQPLQWVAPISETTVASVPSAKTATPRGCRG